jgi:hypothetical protein
MIVSRTYRATRRIDPGPPSLALPSRTCFPATILLSVLSLSIMAGATDEKLQVSADFPGGNIIVEKIERDDVWLHQDLRDTPQFWFYWQFEARGAAGRTIRFHFTEGDVFGSRGPAVSHDVGTTWDWLGRSACDGDNFAFKFAPGDTQVRFAFAIPYTQTNLDAWLESQADNPHLAVEILTRSPAGRDVELLRIGHLHEGPKHRVLITCRHHACESVANFVAEGLMTQVLSGQDEAAWLRENIEFVVIPFMDKDGVEDGDQGKLRHPHDHWLDYSGEARYAEVRALRARFAERLQPVDVALDFHCPYLRDNAIYFATGPDQGIAENATRFRAALEAVQLGSLRYAPGHDLSFGSGWNRPETYQDLRSFMHWAEDLPEAKLVATLEIPYAAVGTETVTPDAARQFGADLANSLARFLRPH